MILVLLVGWVVLSVESSKETQKEKPVRIIVVFLCGQLGAVLCGTTLRMGI